MTAFQVDAFQNNAFQIYIDLAATLAIDLSEVANMAEFHIFAATLGMDISDVIADLRDFGLLNSSGVSSALSVSASLTPIQPLEATIGITITPAVGEGFLRSAGTIFAPAVSPGSVRLRR